MAEIPEALGGGTGHAAPTDPLIPVYAAMSRLVSQETLSGALADVVSLAAGAVPATVGAGVSLMDERGRRTSAASSSALVERADAVQYELDEGPCLAAWRQQEVVRVHDMDAEPRFPRWSAAAAMLGLGSSLSAPLTAGGTRLGAMKLYAGQKRAFDEASADMLVRFAPIAAVLLANVMAYEQAVTHAGHLKQALVARDTIGMAKGILMAQRNVSDEQAFALLVQQSRKTNRKIRDLADDIVQNYRAPQ